MFNSLKLDLFLFIESIIPNMKSSIIYNNEKIMLLNYDNLGLS
jgi:hypothetical protein